jgi:excisionase family DNA binding protein
MAAKGKSDEKQGQLMTVRDVADLLGVNVFVVYSLARENRIPHRRFGRAIRFTRPELDRWLQGEHEVAGELG